MRWPWTKDPEATHLRLGRWGERHAERHLKRQGVKVLGRRVRVGKHDEIDLLAREGRILVVVEVKTRSTEDYAAPRDAVHAEKKYRLSRAALRYARALDPPPAGIRFDIVEVVGRPGKGKPEIRHLPSAFGLDRRFRW
jgi:putative endonuclease